MTNLPALPSYDEAVAAEALRYAKAELQKYYSLDGNPWSNDPLMSAAAGHAFMKDLVENLLLMNTVELRMMVIELAKQGVEEAADALRHLVLELRSKYCELPLELEAYEQEVRWRSSDRWPKKSGPSKVDNMMRDLVYALVVAGVCDRFGLAPTQSSARSASGCRIVAQAAFSIHGGRAYETVKRIWKRFGASMPTVPGWASK